MTNVRTSIFHFHENFDQDYAKILGRKCSNRLFQFFKTFLLTHFPASSTVHYHNNVEPFSSSAQLKQVKLIFFHFHNCQTAFYCNMAVYTLQQLRIVYNAIVECKKMCFNKIIKILKGKLF